MHACQIASVTSNSLRPPWTIASQAPMSLGFSRQKYWSGLSFPPPGDLPNSGIEPRSLMSPVLASEFYHCCHLGSWFWLILKINIKKNLTPLASLSENSVLCGHLFFSWHLQECFWFSVKHGVCGFQTILFIIFERIHSFLVNVYEVDIVIKCTTDIYSKMNFFSLNVLML